MNLLKNSNRTIINLLFITFFSSCIIFKSNKKKESKPTEIANDEITNEAKQKPKPPTKNNIENQTRNNVAETSYNGKLYYVDLVINKNDAKVWLRSDKQNIAIGDLQVAEMTFEKTNLRGEAGKIICEAIESYDSGKGMAGCLSTAGSAICLAASIETAGGTVFSCSTLWTYTFNNGLGDCVDLVKDNVAKALNKSKEWAAFGLGASLPEGKLIEMGVKSLGLACKFAEGKTSLPKNSSISSNPTSNSSTTPSINSNPKPIAAPAPTPSPSVQNPITTNANDSHNAHEPSPIHSETKLNEPLPKDPAPIRQNTPAEPPKAQPAPTPSKPDQPSHEPHPSGSGGIRMTGEGRSFGGVAFISSKIDTSKSIDSLRNLLYNCLLIENSRSTSKGQLINDKRGAITFAEHILFHTYGQKRIIKERPYQVELIDGYWILNGSKTIGINKNTFLIIFSSTNGKVIKLSN